MLLISCSFWEPGLLDLILLLRTWSVVLLCQPTFHISPVQHSGAVTRQIHSRTLSKELWHLFSFLCRPWTAELGYGGSLVPRKTRLLEIFPTWLQQFCSSWFYSFILQLGKTAWKFKKLPIGTGFTATVYHPMPAIAFQKTLRGTEELWTQIPREALIFVLLYIHSQAYEEMLPTTNKRLECHNISSYSLDCHSTFCKTNMLIIFFLNDNSATKLARSSLLDICKSAVCEPVPPPEMVHRKSLQAITSLPHKNQES